MVMLRPATIDDAPALAAIYAEHVRDGIATFDTEPPAAAVFVGKVAEARRRGWPFLIAQRDGTVVGYAHVTQFRDRPAYAHACEDSIYLASSCHRCGIGRALLTALMTAAEAAGFRQMLAVIGGGAPASVGLHAALGFVEVGRMGAVGRKFGRWLDTVYLQRALGEGDATPP